MIDWIRKELPESEQARLRDKLIDWCNINSGSLNLAGLAEMHDRLQDEFGSIADSSESIPLDPCPKYDECGELFDLELGNALRFRTRPDAPVQVLLNGHYDTVYDADHPFQKCHVIEDGKILHGPGVADMKGGLLVMLETLKLLEKSEVKDKIGWQVILNPEEEIGTPGARDLLRDAAGKADFGMVFECSTLEGGLVHRRLGTGFFVAEVSGKSAHAGRDFADGRNAIEALSALILEFRSIYTDMPEVIINTARFHSSTALNAVADRAVAQFNLRAADQPAIEKLAKRISTAVKEIEKGYEVKIAWKGQFDRPPRIPDDAVSAMEKDLGKCYDDLGLSYSWRDTGGGTDGSLLLDYGLPNIDSLGVRGAYLHSDRECMALDSLIEKISVATLYLLRTTAL